MDRIALISDVHGNLTALEAVLADIDARGITRILNLGDYVGKGPRGADVIELCQDRCEVNIRGNWDDFIPDPDGRARRGGRPGGATSSSPSTCRGSRRSRCRTTC